tara:strand:+ start:148 stop:318 length:171 start_codon:yes stop_codon:yes gene_type:complete
MDDVSEDESEVIIMDQGKGSKSRGESRDILMKSGATSKNTISQVDKREIITKYQPN